MTVAFRNVDVAPGTPVAEWPYEAIIATIERGTISDWAILTREIRSDPWGPVARQIEDYLGYEHPVGVAGLLERAIASARAEAEADERAQVVRTVDTLVRESGLTLTDFATRVGTSASRLSTYRSGRVVPSAALMVRMKRVAARLRG